MTIIKGVSNLVLSGQLLIPKIMWDLKISLPNLFQTLFYLVGSLYGDTSMNDEFDKAIVSNLILSGWLIILLEVLYLHYSTDRNHLSKRFK